MNLRPPPTRECTCSAPKRFSLFPKSGFVCCSPTKYYTLPFIVLYKKKSKMNLKTSYYLVVHKRIKLATAVNSKQVYFTYGTMKYSEQYEGTLQTRSVHFHSNRSLTRHNGVFFLFAAFDNFELFLGVPRGRGGAGLLAGGGGRAHRREVLGVAQVEGAARGGALQRRAQLAAPLRICAHALLQTPPCRWHRALLPFFHSRGTYGPREEIGTVF